jgi:hypothetical protein
MAARFAGSIEHPEHMIFLPTIKVDGITPILAMGETPETGVGDDVQTLDMRAPPQER